MKLKTMAIEFTAKILLDKQLWSDVKMFVQHMESRDLSNQEKHQQVSEDVKFIFEGIANYIVNLAITMAVAWIKSSVVKK
jgi:hypothetical protein